jgi:hypothetical protein
LQEAPRLVNRSRITVRDKRDACKMHHLGRLHLSDNRFQPLCIGQIGHMHAGHARKRLRQRMAHQTVNLITCISQRLNLVASGKTVNTGNEHTLHHSIHLLTSRSWLPRKHYEASVLPRGDGDSINDQAIDAKARALAYPDPYLQIVHRGVQLKTEEKTFPGG